MPRRKRVRIPREGGEGLLAHYFAPCPRGLEPLLAEDVAACGGGEIAPIPGGVHFVGTRAVCYRVNLHSRIASRVLCRLASADFRDEDDIYRLAYEIPWPTLFDVSCSLRVDVTAVRAPLKSLAYITLRVKDAVCDRFRAELGRRPDVDTVSPAMRIHLFIAEHQATLYLDTSGEPLWRRGHKIAKVAAPLKENLAAGILRLAGWQPGVPLLDPMCGSGTFLLEAAAVSLNEAPGLSRRTADFAFSRLKDFDAALWQRLVEAARAARRPAEGALPIWGSDSAPDAVLRTRQNLAHAGYEGLVALSQADVLSCTPPAANGILVANPPYGERLGADHALAAFYPRLGDHLKQHFAGWQCWLLTADLRLPTLIGLKPQRRIPLFNGALACRLYGFTIVSGRLRALTA